MTAIEVNLDTCIVVFACYILMMLILFAHRAWYRWRNGA
jgi:hypothetical protein